MTLCQHLSQRWGFSSSRGRGSEPGHRWEPEAHRRQGPSREALGGPVVLGGVSSIGAAWVVSGTGRGGGRPLLHTRRPSRSRGLGTGSGIPHYLRPFPAPSAGCRLLSSPGHIWNELPQGVGGRGPGCSRLPGGAEAAPSPAPAEPPPALSPLGQDEAEAGLGPVWLSLAVRGQVSQRLVGLAGLPASRSGTWNMCQGVKGQRDCPRDPWDPVSEVMQCLGTKD